MDTEYINKLKNKHLLYFVVKLFILLSFIALFDFTVGNCLEYFYFKQKSGRQYRATYSIEKTNEDILIFGSSRAYHHYIPSIITSRTNLSCYNTGSPGQFILYNYATLKATLKRYTPKVVILDIMPTDFRKDLESYDRLSFLLPYYKKHEEIRPIIYLRGSFEKYKLLSSIYPYNSSILMILGGNSEYIKKRNIDQMGYKPLNEIWNKPIQSLSNSSQYELDFKKIECYENFIIDCKNKGIRLFIIVSPSYIIRGHTEFTVSIAQKIAAKYNIKFYDYTNVTTFTSNASLFADPGHLNNNGAKLYTNIVIDKILNEK